MNFANVKAAFGRGQPRPIQQHESLANLTLQSTMLRDRLQTLEDAVQHFDSPEWKWLVEKFLPGETVRLALAATKIDTSSPTYAQEKMFADGQVAQNRRITDKTTELAQEILLARNDVQMLERQIEAVKKRMAKENRT